MEQRAEFACPTAMPQRAMVLPAVRCKYHPDAILADDSHAGDIVCTECGLVVVERCIDVGSEWRTFGSDSDSKDNSRVGAAENNLLNDGDLSTSIMIGPGGAGYGPDGKPIYNSRRQISSSDRALMSAFRKIADMSDRLNIPSNLKDMANTLFKRVHDTKKLRGRSNDAVAASCLYIACRQDEVPRTFKEICAISEVSKKVLGRVFKDIVKAIDISKMEATSTGDYMARFCGNLGLPQSITMASTYIARMATELNLVSGRAPLSVSASAIYMASQASSFPKTAKEIGDIAGVAESTIRQVYRLMYPKATQLFPSTFKFIVPIDQLPRM